MKDDRVPIALIIGREGVARRKRHEKVDAMFRARMLWFEEEEDEDVRRELEELVEQANVDADEVDEIHPGRWGGRRNPLIDHGCGVPKRGEEDGD